MIPDPPDDALRRQLRAQLAPLSCSLWMVVLVSALEVLAIRVPCEGRLDAVLFSRSRRRPFPAFCLSAAKFSI
jgi:hypothetical protein